MGKKKQLRAELVKTREQAKKWLVLYKETGVTINNLLNELNTEKQNSATAERAAFSFGFLWLITITISCMYWLSTKI